MMGGYVKLPIAFELRENSVARGSVRSSGGRRGLKAETKRLDRDLPKAKADVARLVETFSRASGSAADAVASELGVPVLNPAKVALKYAEALVGARLTHSRRAYRTPPKLTFNGTLSAQDLLHVKSS